MRTDAKETSMFKWFKEKAERAAANQCRSSIAVDVQRLVAVSNQTEEHINQTGEANRSDVERVIAAQHRLLDDINLGLSNRLSLQDVESGIGEVLARETVGDGARMAVNHILNHVRGHLRQAI